MLMDEPFGALDPITRDRLQNEFLRLHEVERKTVIFVTHDIDEAIKLGDRIAILREGGVLAQYDTPDAILAAPADDFVARFVGADRGLKRLALRRLDGDRARRRRTASRSTAPRTSLQTTLRDALSLMLTEGAEQLVVVDDDGEVAGRALGRPRQPPARRAMSRSCAAAGPVIPNFGGASDCVTNNDLFCTDWVREQLARRAAAGARRARQADRDRRRDRLRDRASSRRVVARRFRFVRAALRPLQRARLHDPEPRALPAARPVHGADRDDGRDRARRLHAPDPVPQHPRRPARRARRTCSRRRAGWACAAAQILWRIELPLALPAIMAGLRIAVVTTSASRRSRRSSSRRASASRSSSRSATTSRPRSSPPAPSPSLLALAARRRCSCSRSGS